MKTQEGFSRTSAGLSTEEDLSHRKRIPINMQEAPNPFADKINDTSMMTHIKTIRQTEIEKQLTAGLSEQQLLDERK